MAQNPGQNLPASENICRLKPKTRMEKIIVEKHDGKKLMGVLHEAVGTNINGGLIVLCHGYRSNKDQKTILAISNALVQQNFSSFRFDFSGNGGSEGEFQFSNYWGEVDDLRAAIAYFAKKGRNTSAILGHSKGANVVLLYASKYHDVPAVVNVSGRFIMSRGLEERFGIGYMKRLTRDGFIEVQEYQTNGLQVKYEVTLQSVKDRLKINMEESCSQIDKKCRVLTVHGSKDEIIPMEEAFLFEKRVPNHITRIIEGANHCYTSHKAELASAILSFIKDGSTTKASTNANIGGSCFFGHLGKEKLLHCPTSEVRIYTSEMDV